MSSKSMEDAVLDRAVLHDAQDSLGAALDKATSGEDRQLAQVVRDSGQRFVSTLNGLLRMIRLHSLENKAFDSPIHDLNAHMAILVDLLGAINLVSVEDTVYLNDIRVRFDSRSDWGAELGRELLRHRLGGMTFHGLLTEDQIRSLVHCFAQPPDEVSPRGALQDALHDSGVDNLDLFGVFRFRLKGEQQDFEQSADEVSDRGMDVAVDTFENLGADRLPNPLPVRRVVTELLQMGAGAEGLWEEPDGASPYAVHTLRVCRVALLIAEAAGLSEGTLQDLGVAGMFHDVGYASREGAQPATGTEPGHP
ncbi:MAG: hypothetical protein QGG40_14620, partial [Myxococcota bacterium]|nr:hypothetical protein [Myxococcota bacterium]